MRALIDIIESIEQELSTAFHRWFGNSAVVDQQGNPLVMYHGTKNDIDAFDLRKAGVTDPGLVGKAIYFSPSPEQASMFARLRTGAAAPAVRSGRKS